ncbi:MAG: ribonuclease III [Chloroflexi bacterium]|nr:ribonuclease III [Chloroflexota bacterium]
MANQRLESALGLKFRDPKLLLNALRHRSFLNEQGGQASDSYERLEYLGDSVLGLAVAAELFQRFSTLGEGELTKSRAALVCRESLAGVARRLGLGEHLLLGKGEEATGGRQRDSILAAAFEAVVAAVYLDQGYQHASQFILRTMSKELEDLIHQGGPPENPKSRLQEYVQGLGRATPKYHMVSSRGPDHDPVFTVEVLVGEEAIGSGQGSNLADAERFAAEEALARLLSD